MMSLQDLYAQSVQRAEEALEAKRAKGEDTLVEELDLKIQKAGLAMVKGAERLEMFDESRDDHYSARRAATHYRAAGELLLDVARGCDELAQDPHAAVLHEAGIKDT